MDLDFLFLCLIMMMAFRGMLATIQDIHHLIRYLGAKQATHQVASQAHLASQENKLVEVPQITDTLTRLEDSVMELAARIRMGVNQHDLDALSDVVDRLTERCMAMDMQVQKLGRFLGHNESHHKLRRELGRLDTSTVPSSLSVSPPQHEPLSPPTPSSA